MPKEKDEDEVQDVETMAEEALASRLKMMRAMHESAGLKHDAYLIQSHAAQLISQNTLHTDMGRFGEPSERYDFDVVTRDRLIAHARQDAAGALVLSSNTLERVSKLQNSVDKVLGVHYVLLGLVALVALLFCVLWFTHN